MVFICFTNHTTVVEPKVATNLALAMEREILL